MSIFSDMVKDTIEVFMDDFLLLVTRLIIIYVTMAEVLKRCENCNLMLNWDKCHFMVK